MVGIVLNSPQGGGTHALISLLKGLGLRLVGRHRDGVWYPKIYPKNLPKETNGVLIAQGFEIPVFADEFITGHSSPFVTTRLVICSLRDPRNIALCHWRRSESQSPFIKWRVSDKALTRIATIPQHWEWNGDNVLRVWYEDIQLEKTQREVAEFCGVNWKNLDFYGHGKTWSGQPSNWCDKFDPECDVLWDSTWQKLTGQSWNHWWSLNREVSYGVG